MWCEEARVDREIDEPKASSVYPKPANLDRASCRFLARSRDIARLCVVRIQCTIVPRKLLQANRQKEGERDDHEHFAVNAVSDEQTFKARELPGECVAEPPEQTTTGHVQASSRKFTTRLHSVTQHSWASFCICPLASLRACLPSQLPSWRVLHGKHGALSDPGELPKRAQGSRRPHHDSSISASSNIFRKGIYDFTFTCTTIADLVTSKEANTGV